MVMKIYCDYCGQTWEVYPSGEPMRPSASKCPHCGAAKVKPETWREMVDCLKHVDKVNMMLASDHVNERYIQFAVSYLADSPFQCANRFIDD